jgi:hypothetical protein
MISSLNPNPLSPLSFSSYYPPTHCWPPKSQKRHMSQCSKYMQKEWTSSYTLLTKWWAFFQTPAHPIHLLSHFFFPSKLISTSPYKSIQNIKPQFSSTYIFKLFFKNSIYLSIYIYIYQQLSTILHWVWFSSKLC